jgi:hypothetical protein
MGVHKFGALKFLRFEHRDEQIHAERDGDDSKNEVFHKSFGQSFSQPRA